MDSEVFPLNSGKVQAQKDPTEEVEAAHFVQIYYLKKYFHFLSQLQTVDILIIFLVTMIFVFLRCVIITNKTTVKGYFLEPREPCMYII